MPKVLRFLDVDHAVLADLLDGVGDDVADLTVAGGDGGHAGDVFFAGDLFGLLLDLGDGRVDGRSMPRLMAIGLAPAATFLRPSRTMAWASRVAVVVPSPAMSLVLVATSRHELGALVLEDVFEFDLTSDGHTVVGDGGAPNFLSSTT